MKIKYKLIQRIRSRLVKNIWTSPSLSELTPIIFDIYLTHFGSAASIWIILRREIGKIFYFKFRIMFHNYMLQNKWRPLSISELTLIISNIELTHLGSKAFKYKIKFQFNFLSLYKDYYLSILFVFLFIFFSIFIFSFFFCILFNIMEVIDFYFY